MKGPLAGESRMSSSLANVKKKKKKKIARSAIVRSREKSTRPVQSLEDAGGRRVAKVRRREELDSLSKSGQTIMDVL